MPFYDVIAVEVIAESDATIDIASDSISGLEATEISVSYTYGSGRPRASAFTAHYTSTNAGADHEDPSDVTDELTDSTTVVAPTDGTFNPATPMDADGSQNGTFTFTAPLVTATTTIYLRLGITQASTDNN